MSFSEFMCKQIQAIEESGLTAEEWIELYAEAFRAANPVKE